MFVSIETLQSYEGSEVAVITPKGELRGLLVEIRPTMITVRATEGADLYSYTEIAISQIGSINR